MKRREFIAMLCGSAAWPLAARAQPDRRRKIGVLAGIAADYREGNARLAAFLQGLQQLGWTEGQNLQIEYRWAAGNRADLRKYAAELIGLAPDVICPMRCNAPCSHRSGGISKRTSSRCGFQSSQ